MLTPNEEARAYFYPLTYDDVSKADWRYLIAILQKHIDRRNEEQLKIKEEKGFSDYTYEIDKCVWNKESKHKKFSAYINVKLDGYSIREGISFNPDGFIGFAGWASSYNTILFTDAFKEWVDFMKNKPEYKFKQSLNISPEEILTKSGMTPDQYREIVNSYYVKEFPENPVLGRMVCKDGIQYVYTSQNKWCSLQAAEEKLFNITELVNNWTDCELKNKILELL